MFTHLYRQSISCVLAAALLSNSLYAGGIVVDGSVPSTNRAGMDITANGIPLVYIVKPNSSGLSHNKFSDFNIEQKGIILNNATSAAQTQLGGWVQGNANLGTTPARVILNEVTGTSRSLLQGYGEVAGHAADVIIANPNGVTVNGGGFINTPRATLTTGTPEFSGNALSGFHVQGGDILIEGNGLNAVNIDRVDLYTKALRLNAQLYAKKLDVVTGENHIATDGTVTSDGVTGSGYSIDSSALGGIYGSTIRLMGTDKGVGINLPQITYASDSLELTAEGQIVIGSAYATNKIEVTSAQDAITLTTDVATDVLTLTASKSLLNTGKVSVNNASIHADSLINDMGSTLAAQTLDATFATTITNNGMLMAQTASIAAQDLFNNGSAVTDRIELNIDHLFSNNGLLSAYTQMGIHALDMSNGVSAEIAAKNLTITLGNGFSNEGAIGAETMNLMAGTFLNQGDVYTDTINILSNQIVQNSGTVAASSLATIETKSLANTSGAAISSSTLNMNVQEDIANAGSIIAHNGSMNADNMENSGNVIVDTANLNLFHSLTNTGIVSGSEKITVNALDMTNSAGATIAAKEMAITLNGNISNSGSFLGDTVSLKAHSLTNAGEIYGSIMNMELADSITNQGILSAFTELNLYATSLANQSGATLEATTLNAEAITGINNQGMLRASTLSLLTPTLTNDATILADTLAIEAANMINNALLKGSNSANITVNNTITNNGGIIGGNQLAIHADTISNNEMLYSANAIDLSASNTLRNTEGSTIKSAGSINIHDTGTLRNEAARIEAIGDMTIQAVTLENLSTNVPTKTSLSSSSSEVIMVTYNVGDWKDTFSTLESINKSGYTPAYILSGRDLKINSKTHNRYSMIATDGDMYLSGSLNNEAGIDAHNIINTTNNYLYLTLNDGVWHYGYTIYEYSDTIIDHLYSTIQAGGNIYGDLISVNNADVLSGSPVTNFSSQSIISPVADSISSKNISYNSTDILVYNNTYRLPDGEYGEFVRASDPNLPYLIESNPLYAEYNSFIGSEYMMSHLNLNMAADTKRLGDARYETQLVRDAVFHLTGERYLAGFGSDTAQYQALMDNAVAVSGDLHLEFGVKLSASQVATLNRDIVWMEEQEVAGQKVLVPVVYLASLKSTKLTPGGKIIAGGDMQLVVEQGLNNGGEIRAGGNLLVQSDTIANTAGTIKSTGDMVLHTVNDITNSSGKISGNNVAIVSDKGNIISQTALKNIDLNDHIMTTGNLSTVGEKSSLQSSGNMILTASKNINFTGTDAVAGTNMSFNAQNVTVNALEQNSHHKSVWGDGSNEIESVKQHASTLSADGDVSINSVKDVTINSSSIVGKGVVLNAGENVNIIAANDREFMDVQTHSKSRFSSSSERSMSLKESVVSSNITGDNIQITSGKDTTLQATNLKAQENIQVDASGDINVLAKTYREASLHQESKSSFGGLVSSTSLDSSDVLKLHEATVKTEAKNIIMNSGKDISIVASNVSAGDAIGLKAAQNVNIVSDKEQDSQQHYSKKSGLSLGFSDGMLTISEEKQTQDAKANITQKSSNLSGKAIAVEAGQDITSIGSNMTASTIDINAQRDVNLLSATESASHEHKESTAKAGIGVTLNINEASLFAGVITKSDKLGEGQTQEVSSQLVGDNITIQSGNNTNVLASNSIANNDVSIQAGKNINILSEDATAYKNQVHEELKAGIKVGVQQHVTDAAKQLADTAESLPESDNAINTGSKVLKSVDLITNTLSHAVSVGFDAIAEISKSETSAKSTSAQSSTIAAGHDVTLDATKRIMVAGSDVIASNKISINAEEITLKSSAQTAFSSSSEKSGSLKVTLFGSNEGQVDASYAQSKNRSNDTTQRDTYVNGNNVIINTSGDTTLQGAHVSGNTVTANIDGNLNLISVQDTGSSKGDSESIALSSGGSVSVGAGKSSSSKAWVEEQTGIIATNRADITVAGNTDLQGAIIAIIDAQGNDVNNVHLTTGTLSTSDIADHDKSTSMSIGLGNITAAQFQTNSQGTTGGTLEAGYSYSDKEQINRATIGGGTITLANQEALPTTLNRDVTKAQEITKDESENYDIYASQNSINSVLNPTQTAEKWKQSAKDMGLSVHKEITENLPGSNDTGLAGVVGKALDTVAFAGVLPSQGNGGGYITQIATQLTGDNRNMIILKDKQQLLVMGIPETDIQEVIQTNKITGEEIHVYTTNPSKAVRIDEQPIDSDPLGDYKIHVSSEAIKAANLDHLFINGMFNPVDVAIYNQQTQQGGANSVLNYNQTHGLVGDLIEDVQDHLTSNSGLSVLGTGGSRQTGEVIDQMAKVTNGNLTVGSHSQGTMMTQNGMNLYKDDLQEIMKNNPNSQLLVGYAGSPVNYNVAADLVTEIYGGESNIKNRMDFKKGISDVFRSQVNPQDLVGSLLGWQSAGVNQNDNVLLNVGESLLRLPSLFIPSEKNPSPHSYYPCIIGCGDNSVTPKMNTYPAPKDINNQGQTPLEEYYKTLNVDLNLYTKDNQ